MWSNLFFSLDQGFGEKTENKKWLEYMAKNCLSNGETVCWLKHIIFKFINSDPIIGLSHQKLFKVTQDDCDFSEI